MTRTKSLRVRLRCVVRGRVVRPLTVNCVAVNEGVVGGGYAVRQSFFLLSERGARWLVLFALCCVMIHVRVFHWGAIFLI